MHSTAEGLRYYVDEDGESRWAPPLAEDEDAFLSRWQPQAPAAEPPMVKNATMPPATLAAPSAPLPPTPSPTAPVQSPNALSPQAPPSPALPPAPPVPAAAPSQPPPPPLPPASAPEAKTVPPLLSTASPSPSAAAAPAHTAPLASLPSRQTPQSGGFDVATACEALTELHKLCRDGDGAAMGAAGDAASLATRVNTLKVEMITAARQSHVLQLELQELEKMIALHIRHRMEVEDKKPRRVVVNKAGGSASLRPSADDRGRYETLAYLVRLNPWWLAKVIGAVSHTYMHVHMYMHTYTYAYAYTYTQPVVARQGDRSRLANP